VWIIKVVQDFDRKLTDLVQQRKNNQISSKEFYFSLLSLVNLLATNSEKNDLSEVELKRKTSLLLLFLKNQFKNLQNR
jgi:hypothetical protein